MNCRFCGTPLEHIVLDLGFAPPSNAYLTKDDLARPEKYYPLKIFSLRIVLGLHEPATCRRP